jgi:hypothetical protein
MGNKQKNISETKKNYVEHPVNWKIAFFTLISMSLHAQSKASKFFSSDNSNKTQKTEGNLLKLHYFRISWFYFLLPN